MTDTSRKLAAALIAGGAIVRLLFSVATADATEPMTLAAQTVSAETPARVPPAVSPIFRPGYICPCPTPYCKKTAPSVVCLPPASCCDDYCKKPLPWWCVPCAQLCDDYCKKPEPHYLPPAPCGKFPNCRR